MAKKLFSNSSGGGNNIPRERDSTPQKDTIKKNDIDKNDLKSQSDDIDSINGANPVQAPNTKNSIGTSLQKGVKSKNPNDLLKTANNLSNSLGLSETPTGKKLDNIQKISDKIDKLKDVPRKARNGLRATKIGFMTGEQTAKGIAALKLAQLADQGARSIATGVLNSNIGQLAQWGLDTAKSVGSTISNFYSSATGAISSGASQIGSAFSSLAGTIGHTMSSAMGSVIAGVNSVINIGLHAFGSSIVVSSALPTVVAMTLLTGGAGIVGYTIFQTPDGSSCFITTSDKSNTDNRQAFLEYAESIGNGKKYKMGAAGPDYYDCSGLVQAALKHFGINYPHDSMEQKAKVTVIDKSEAKPGDLIFYGEHSGGAGHVGIYAGGDKYYSALSPESKPNIGMNTIPKSMHGTGPTYGRIEQLVEGSSSSSVTGSDNSTTSKSQIKVAKEVTKFYKSKGATGVGIAAVLGNIQHESSFNPASIQSGLAYNKSTAYGNGGGYAFGLNQWDRGRRVMLLKYADSKNTSWKNVQVQLNFAYSIDSGKAILHKVLLMKGDVGTATEYFRDKWEVGGDGTTAARQKAAVMWYKKLNLSSIEGSGKLSGVDDSVATSNSDAASSAKAADANDCDVKTNNSSNSATADGTGSVPFKTLKLWTWDTLPDSVKKYAHDPRKVGLSWGLPNGWYNFGGQCVHFVSSYFHKVWKTSEKPMIKYGRTEATEWAAAMNGVTTKTPHEGSIISIPGKTKNYSHSKYGHTEIVQHVFANGDLLVAEENIKGYSGSNNHTPGTWNFRLVPKSDYTSKDFQFFTPKSGKPDWGD